jgi:hemoglobin
LRFRNHARQRRVRNWLDGGNTVPDRALHAAARRVLMQIKLPAAGRVIACLTTRQPESLQKMNQQTATAEAETEPTPYSLMGGEAAVRRLVDRFYDIMDSAPQAAGIRGMHAADLGPMRQLLFEFLSGWLGGPPLYFQRPEHRCIRSAHRPFAIGEAERDAWMLCMRQAMADCGVPQEVRGMIDRPLARMAEAFSNR